jgi:hypothetical protein
MAINTDYRQLKDARVIEDIMCLSVLIAKEVLPHDSTIYDAIGYFLKINDGAKNADCSNCPFNNICLACIINE